MKTSWRCLFRKRLDQDEYIHLIQTSSEDVLKTSWSRPIHSPYSNVFRRCLEDVLIKTNIFVLVIRLQESFKTSSRRLQDVLRKRLQGIFKTFSKRFQNVSLLRHLQNVLKTSCKNVFKTSSRRFEDVFKTSSRHLQEVLQRCLQDVFKTYHQVKLFLLTRFQDVFEMYSKCFWDVLEKRLSAEGLA